MSLVEQVNWPATNLAVYGNQVEKGDRVPWRSDGEVRRLAREPEVIGAFR